MSAETVTHDEELVQRAKDRVAARRAATREAAPSSWRQLRNRSKRTREQRLALQLARDKARILAGVSRASVHGTHLGAIVVFVITDGKAGGRRLNAILTPGEALRFAAATAWRAVIAWWER